jgi:hypothetical protein
MWALIGSVIGWIWDGLQAAETAVIYALQVAYIWLKAGVSAIWDAAKFVWSDVVKPIGSWLEDAWQQVKGIYDRFIAPAVAWLQRLSAALKLVYNTFIAPILTTIDAFRKVLNLLELLHVQWAQQLDAALQNLEHKITGPLLLVIQTINAIDSRIESYVLTVDNLFNSFTLLGSISRDLNPILNFQWSRLMGTLTDKQKAGPSGASGLEIYDQHVTTLDQALAGDEESTGADIAALVKVLDDALMA